MSRSETTSFAALATASCPAYVDMLLAVEGQFTAVSHPDWASEYLDDRARALFGLAGEPVTDQAVALVAAVSEILPHTRALDQSLFLSAALRRGVAAASIRSAVAAELGRRAGVAASVARDGREWRLLVTAGGRGFLVDPALGLLRGDRSAQPVCGHHVGFAVLGELAALYVPGRRDLARRACELQLRLPIDEATRVQVQLQIERIEGGS